MTGSTTELELTAAQSFHSDSLAVSTLRYDPNVALLVLAWATARVVSLTAGEDAEDVVTLHVENVRDAVRRLRPPVSEPNSDEDSELNSN